MPAPQDPIKYMEWKKNISKSNMGHKTSEETRKKIGNSHRGTIVLEETKRKISMANQGHIPWNKGYHATYEEMYGKEKAERILEKRRQVKQSMETINKRVIKLRGQKRSEEIKQKMRESRLQFCKNHPEWSKNFSATIKGKTYEERCGVDITKKLKAKIKERETEHLRNITNQRKGKTYEEIYGSERAKELMKENHPNWKGGISDEPYTLDFNKNFKELIRQRDNHCCVVCNKIEEECPELLHIHHINYNKLNTFPQNDVSLCRPCHSKTNFNRQHWIVFFQSLLKERYGYEYTEDQKIILDFMGRT